MTTAFSSVAIISARDCIANSEGLRESGVDKGRGGELTRKGAHDGMTHLFPIFWRLFFCYFILLYIFFYEALKVLKLQKKKAKGGDETIRMLIVIKGS